MTKRSTKQRRIGIKIFLAVISLIIIASVFIKMQNKDENVLYKQTVITKLEYPLLQSKEVIELKQSINNIPESKGFIPTDKDYTLFAEDEYYDLGNSYVEIDLTRQKVWVYVNGNIEVETDCVTGCIDKGHETPTGIFTLTYKEKDKVLRGQKLENGSYEYESPVSYWMPFNGGIGLHDATWRDTFGGNIYISNGSHGCINLPLDAAEKIYDIITSDMPIVVYKSY